jgi:hypothetical protein
MIKKLFGLTILSYLFSSIPAQAEASELSGPRIGITALTPGSSSNFVGSNHLIQYGWQLETKFSDGDGLNGLVEWVFLVGGMEQGYFLPSISSLVGLRQESGFEFGAGPNLSISGIGFVTAVGYNFKSGAMNLPVNIFWVPSTSNSWFSPKEEKNRSSNLYYLWV